MTLPQAVAAFVHDGDTVALEGFTHLIPFAAGHEIIRQGRKDLTLIRMTPDLIYDQMIGMGMAREAGVFLGRQSRRRLAAPPARRRRARLAATARDRGTQPRAPWPRLRSRRRGPALRLLSRLSRHRSADGESRHPLVSCPFTGESTGVRSLASGRMSRSSTRRRPTAKATCSSKASSACRRRRCSRHGAPS